MTKQRRSLAYSAEYKFGDDNILTATFLEEARLRNRQRVKQAHSVLNTVAECRTVNNAKRLQQEQDRDLEIAQHNQILLERLESIHKKLPKQFDVSHHSQEYLRPTNYLLWQQEQDRIEEENKRMQRRINQTKSLFDTKQLAVDAAKHRYLSDQLSKADRRMHVKHKCKELELQSNSRRGHTDSSNYSPSKPSHHRKRHHHRKNVHESELYTMEGIHEFSLGQQEIHRDTIKLPRVRAPHKIESKYATSTDNFPTVTNTTKLIRASDLLNS